MLNNLLGSRRGMILVGGAVAVVAAGAIAVYVISGDTGNGTEVAQNACNATVASAEGLAPLVRGDIAAFRVADEADPLTDLVFTAGEGEASGVADFGGRTVLLNLWATWCGPCRAEMPALDRLQAELGDDRFEVVAVNIDTSSVERAREFLDEVGVENLAFYVDSSTKIFTDLKRRGLALGLPVTLLIDGNGCRLGGMQGPAEWDSEDAKALIEAAKAAAEA